MLFQNRCICFTWFAGGSRRWETPHLCGGQRFSIANNILIPFRFWASQAAEKCPEMLAVATYIPWLNLKKPGNRGRVVTSLKRLSAACAQRLGLHSSTERWPKQSQPLFRTLAYD